MAAKGRSLQILQKIWDWAKEKLASEDIKNNLVLTTDHNRMNACHEVAQEDHLDLLHKLQECAKEKLTREELNIKLLLATHRRGKPHLLLQ
jgi:hypothetical protein